MMKFWLTLLLVMGLTLPITAQAKVYKNSANAYGEGKYSMGLAHDSLARSFTSSGAGSFDITFSSTVVNATIGVGQQGAIGIGYGAASGAIEGGDTGTGDGGGLGYRHALKPQGSGLEHGFQISYGWGYVEDDFVGVWFNQLDLVYNVAKPLSSQASFYGGGGLSQANLTAEIFSSGATYDAEGASSLGAFGGVEFKLSEQFLAGFEVHLLHESGIGLYVDIFF